MVLAGMAQLRGSRRRSQSLFTLKRINVKWTHQPKAYGFDTGFICYARGWDCTHNRRCRSNPDLQNLHIFRRAYPNVANFLVVPDSGGRRKLKLKELEVELVSPADLMPGDTSI
jgi:hypothetical protein